ncbi:MAG: delta-class carbonic anhydrase [Pseudomonadota bacterium]
MKLHWLIPTTLVIALYGCGADDTPDPAAPAGADDAPTESAAAAEPQSPGLCLDAGPQTPRDISDPAGLNPVEFEMAPAYTELNLCNIHTHTNAEHKGPGFSVFVGDSDDGGYACNAGADLTPEELTDPLDGQGAYQGVNPGDTIEVHWVHSSCDVQPGEGLGSCLTEACSDPLLRVEAQVFLVVNDPDALDFTELGYGDTVRDGFHQAMAIPDDTGEPVVFRGSTTGPSYTQENCSPLQVTWSVRPQCTRVDISSLHRWAENGNVFNETKSHGVRQLVTAPELLAPIEDAAEPAAD